MVTVQCQDCGSRYRFKSQEITKIRCPKCGSIVSLLNTPFESQPEADQNAPLPSVPPPTLPKQKKKKKESSDNVSNQMMNESTALLATAEDCANAVRTAYLINWISSTVTAIALVLIAVNALNSLFYTDERILRGYSLEKVKRVVLFSPFFNQLSSLLIGLVTFGISKAMFDLAVEFIETADLSFLRRIRLARFFLLSPLLCLAFLAVVAILCGARYMVLVIPYSSLI